MKNFILIFSVVFISTLTGCTFYRVNADEIAFKTTHPRENHKDIQYLETITVPYEVIGTVVVNTERRNSINEVVEKMKYQVATLGGDAITNIVQYDEPSPITRIRTRYTGTVIIFKDAAPAAPAHQSENFK